jgi:pyruvate/2-oxoglutarate dehydrogenase complex dihydrolipoamide dehydrogenase (E3) component
MSKKYDAIVIGAGQSGPALAERFVNEGMRVAVIERKHFGGTCVNTGCQHRLHADQNTCRQRARGSHGPPGR